MRPKQPKKYTTEKEKGATDKQINDEIYIAIQEALGRKATAAHDKMVADFKKKMMDNGVDEKFATDEAKKYTTEKENGATDKQINDEMYLAIQEEKRLKAEADALAKYTNWRDSQFSAWDGSISVLVKSVKAKMNNPDSFKHVETTYQDLANYKGFKARMVFRGTNSFNAVVTNSVLATFDYDTQKFTWVFE